VKITRLDSAPESEPLAEPDYVALRNQGQSALATVRAQLDALQARLSAVELEATQCQARASQSYLGSPEGIDTHLERVDADMKKAAVLHNEADVLRCKITIVEKLQARIQEEVDSATQSERQAVARDLLTDARLAYTVASEALMNACIDLGAAAILSNNETGWLAAIRNLLIPTVHTLNVAVTPKPGFVASAQGVKANPYDPVYAAKARACIGMSHPSL